MTKPFSGMSDDARVFYSRLFTDMMLNIHAVRLGLFPVYLSETESSFYFGLWHEAMPKITKTIYQKLQQQQKDGHN